MATNNNNTVSVDLPIVKAENFKAPTAKDKDFTKGRCQLSFYVQGLGYMKMLGVKVNESKTGTIYAQFDGFAGDKGWIDTQFPTTKELRHAINDAVTAAHAAYVAESKK